MRSMEKHLRLLRNEVGDNAFSEGLIAEYLLAGAEDEQQKNDAYAAFFYKQIREKKGLNHAQKRALGKLVQEFFEKDGFAA